LEYSEYRNFIDVIEKAKIACENSGYTASDHFVEADDMVSLGSGAKREIKTVFLSRYACYLIVQSADPSKEVVALGHSYFAMQTRRQELEDEHRLQLREEMREHNKQLASAAKKAGVIQPLDYAIFQNKGYQGLYGGQFAANGHLAQSPRFVMPETAVSAASRMRARMSAHSLTTPGSVWRPEFLRYMRPASTGVPGYTASQAAA
jgi:DNA-damage-inducible protein D